MWDSPYPKGMRALRYDYVRLDGMTETPQGGLRIPAALTRTGIFEYTRPDGSKTRELRTPEEVFNKSTLDSFENAPLTIGHVPAVTPDNWGAVAVGHVVGVPKKDGDFVSADCTIARRDAIMQVKSGQLKELSCGYEVELDPTPGVWQGQQYDAIQTKIRGNHVALLPAGSGRAGPDVKLRTDSKDEYPGGIAHRSDEAPTQGEREEMHESEFADPENKKYPIDTPEHTRAAASYAAKEHNAGRLSDAKFKEISARINKAREKHGIGEENKDSKDAYPSNVSATPQPNQAAPEPKQDSTEVLLGRIESLNAKNAELQARADSEAQRIEAAATARADLLARVVPHMAKEWKADGKSEVQIIRESLTTLRPEIKLDGRSDDYVRGAFEEAVRGVETSRSRTASMQVPFIAPVRLDKAMDGMDPDMDELEMKNKAAKQKSKDAWKTPPKGAMTRDALRK